MTSDPQATAIADFSGGEPDTLTPAALPRRVIILLISILSLISLLMFGTGAYALAPGAAQWPDAAAWTVRVVLLACSVIMVVTAVLAHRHGGTDGQTRLAHVLLGVGWILFSQAVIALVVRVILWIAGLDDPLRSRLVAVVLALDVLALCFWSFRQARRVPAVRRTSIPVEGLTAPVTVAVLTDTHYDPWTTPQWSRAVVARVNELGADVVVHAGDLADGQVAQREAQTRPLGEVRARHRFYILGNHEYYSGAAPWHDHMQSLGWTVLVNRHEVITDERGGSLVVAGVDDPDAARAPVSSSHPTRRGPDLDAALAQAPSGVPVLLLAHQPHLVAQARDRVDVQLSGHTHGGQIWPFHYLVRLREPVIAGLSQHGTRTRLYVSRGTGFWGPPFRLGAPSEISLITLVPR
ncbi:MAG: metallophosphoesterase [Kineosporiaceae bacterium]